MLPSSSRPKILERESRQLTETSIIIDYPFTDRGMDRRAALSRITAIVGGIGVIFASIPFIRYFLPSERAKGLGAPVTIDISDFEIGDTRAFVWRGQPILVMKRTQAQLDALELSNGRLLDTSGPDVLEPNEVDPVHRGRKAEYLVVVGTCTHFGCIPIQETLRGRSLVGEWWPGGFTCPCHGSVYDFAGRVVRGPAPRNLRIPPHYFASPSTIVVGVNSEEA